MKLRICKHCKSKFRPSRADAEFCRNLCRQAAYRMRRKDHKFEKTQHRARRMEDEAALAIRVFESYRREAARLHIQAEERDIKDVKFLGTPCGILAAEKVPGALRLAVARCDWPGGQLLREMIETEGYSKSPEMLAVIPRQPATGATFIEREAEKECRDLLSGPECKVSLFAGHTDDDGEVWMRPFPAGHCPPPDPFDACELELDREHVDGGFSGDAMDLLAGGGFHVTR